MVKLLYPTSKLVRMGSVLVACWIVMVALPSIKEVRALMISPLYVNDEDAAGDIAYVMADGSAYLERLRAASDLYHMHRVPIIYILDERRPAGYNFVTQHLDSTAERAIGYLESFGVPRHAVQTVTAPNNAIMGSLSEAVAVQQVIPKNVDQIVVVTSAPHTRRSRLCFQRSLSSKVKVSTYSASVPIGSAELYAPIFHEYLKLAIYYFFA